MKKAVIVCGGSQYLVAEGDEITVNKINSDKKTLEFKPIMLVNGDSSIVDSKKLESAKVSAKIIEENLKGDKVTALRYKAKKRVNTKRGHRQQLTKIKITAV